MRLFTRIAIFFYVTVISVVSGFVILIASRILTLDDVMYYVNATYSDTRLSMLVGLISGTFILISFLLAKIIFGSEQKERTIAFDNPSGRVSISLSAVEDLVRRLLQKIPEIKEVRPNIIATKRGLEIESRLILKTDVNIPEMTAKLQDLIKSRVQDVLGIEETVVVRIHVVKIVSDELKEKSKRAKDDDTSDTEEPTIPFQGYRS